MNATQLRDELLHTAEQLARALETEERTGEAIDSMNRAYWEGYNEALGLVVTKLIKEDTSIKKGRIMKLTETTAKGLAEGLPYFGFTRCPSCSRIFADGIEGAPSDKNCDNCWHNNKQEGN